MIIYQTRARYALRGSRISIIESSKLTMITNKMNFKKLNVFFFLKYSTFYTDFLKKFFMI